MAKYRKKPIVVNAVQWTGHNFAECEKFYPGIEKTGNHLTTGGLIITTLEGNMIAQVGWWIIKGVKGEFYPCDPDIFELTYEKVED